MIILTLYMLSLECQQDNQVIFSKHSALIQCNRPAVSKPVYLKCHLWSNIKDKYHALVLS